MSTWLLADVFPLWCQDDAAPHVHTRAPDGRSREPSGDTTAPHLERRRADAAIVVALRDGDVRPFEAFFVREYATLVDFATAFTRDRSLAEDVVSDVFVWIYRHRTSLSITGTLIAYMMGAVRHRALDALRAQRREQTRHAQLKQEAHASVVPAQTMDPETATIQRETLTTLRTTVMTVLEQCTASSRMAFLLRAQQGLSFAEVGSVLGISENAAKKQVGRVIRVLRDALPGVID